MGEKLIIPLVLQSVGIIVIIAEIILPSGGLLSILATGLFAYSLYDVFSTVSTSVGLVFITADAIIIPVTIILGLKLLAKSPATLNTTLSSEDGVTSQSPELEKYIGKEGVALTDLRPAGAAKIDGRRVDVVTRGEYIEKSTEVIVRSITGNQIIVGKK